jgi:hypothetical protein
MILILIGVGLYVVNKHVPMAPSIKNIINVVVVVAVVFWLVELFGLLNVGPVVGHHR